MTEMNLIDLAVAVYLIFGMIRGFLRGLSGELARVVSMVVVLALGWQFYRPLGAKLVEITRLGEGVAQWAAFLLIVVVAGVAAILLRWILRNLVEFSFKGAIEKVGGMAAGVVRSGIWVVLAVVAATLSPSEYLGRVFGQESRIGSLIVRSLIPAYQRLASDYPELQLPAIPEEESAPAGGGGAEAEAAGGAEAVPAPADGD